MNHATIGRRTYDVPGRFAELSPRQLIAVVGLLHSARPVVEVRLRVLLVLLGARRRPWLAFLLWFRISAEQRYLLLKLTDFVFADPRLYQQLLPTLRVGPWYRRRRLHGPGSSFLNLCFAEFIDCEGHFFGFGRSHQVADLDRLVATLYRPHAGAAAAPADGRQAYDPATVAGRQPAVAGLPLAVKLAVRMWYASCRQAWARKYEGTIFGAPAAGQAAAGGDPRVVWHEVLATGAGTPDRYDLYGRITLPNVLYDLDRRQRLRQEQEATRRQRS